MHNFASSDEFSMLWVFGNCVTGEGLLFTVIKTINGDTNEVPPPAFRMGCLSFAYDLLSLLIRYPLMEGIEDGVLVVFPVRVFPRSHSWHVHGF
jgi:hypothetical protein